ncbi:hypothetical protein [Jiella sp. M17.18]|uniref:hypothetical protein n=1 Tax=Jiella sp. M17.18 TaxID=3234247 RepID=UPI0034DF4886
MHATVSERDRQLAQSGHASSGTREASPKDDRCSAKILPVGAATLFGAAIRFGRLGILSERGYRRLIRQVAALADAGDPTAHLVHGYLLARSKQLSLSGDRVENDVREMQ